jgi:hypothetical protein
MEEGRGPRGAKRAVSVREWTQDQTLPRWIHRGAKGDDDDDGRRLSRRASALRPPAIDEGHRHWTRITS